MIGRFQFKLGIKLTSTKREVVDLMKKHAELQEEVRTLSFSPSLLLFSLFVMSYLPSDGSLLYTR